MALLITLTLSMYRNLSVMYLITSCICDTCVWNIQFSCCYCRVIAKHHVRPYRFPNIKVPLRINTNTPLHIYLMCAGNTRLDIG